MRANWQIERDPVKRARRISPYSPLFGVRSRRRDGTRIR